MRKASSPIEQVHMGLVAALTVCVLVLGACTGSTASLADNETTSPLPVTAEELVACGVDNAERDRLLSLPPSLFDQDIDGGWRAVSAIPDCELAAATLLVDYIAANDIEPDDGVMHWHIGQLLALAGKNEEAIPWLETTATETDPTWNLYVNGTIAFLVHDRVALEDAIESLASVEVLESEKVSRRQYLQENPDFEAPDGFVDEPQNLGVLRGLASCFEDA
jgi:hypothetical protein